MLKLILASNSPRRKEILLKAGYDFKVVPSNYDEKINGLKYSEVLVENCAFQKALDVKNRVDNDCVIVSADTVVVLDDIILGKPKDKNDAFEILKSLSEKTHFVATSICLIYKNQVIKKTQKTYVTFKKLSNNDILSYINLEKPLDKAGSYGIQDKNFNFAIDIKGEFDNVVGFPLKLFKMMYEQLTV